MLYFEFENELKFYNLEALTITFYATAVTVVILPGSRERSGRVLDLRPRGRRFKPHQRHCVVSLIKNINPSFKYWFNPGRLEKLMTGCKESIKQTNLPAITILVHFSFK